MLKKQQYQERQSQYKSQQDQKINQSQSQLPTPKRFLTHFKNSLHDGFFFQPPTSSSLSSPSITNGPGISLLDSGPIVLSTFSHDQPHSLTLVFLNFTTYFIGNFHKGILDGPFVMRSSYFTIYANFNRNKIVGELLLINYQKWDVQLWEIHENGQGEISKQMGLGELINVYMSYEQLKRIQGKIGQGIGADRQKDRAGEDMDKTKFIGQEQIVIKAMAPYMEKMPNVSQFVKLMKTGSNQFQGMGPQIFVHKIYQNNEIIMLNPNTSQNSTSNKQFLAIVLNKKQQLIAYGQFKQSQFQKIPPKQKHLSYEFTYKLNGIGTKCQQFQSETSNSIHQSQSQYQYQSPKSMNPARIKIVYFGQFQNNSLYGQGTKQIKGQKIIYGKFVDGNIRNVDVLKICQAGSEDRNGERRARGSGDQSGSGDWDGNNQEIKRMELKRMKFIHIHSLNFYNNYSNQRPIFILRNLYQMMKPKNIA